MIFPFINGILSVVRAPMTWILFLINLIVFLSTFDQSSFFQQKLENLVRNETFSRVQGEVFAEFVQEHSSRYPASINALADEVLVKSDNRKASLLGSLAMRDGYFLNSQLDGAQTRDPIAFSWWQNKMNQILDLRNSHPSYNLGVTQTENNLYQWISYQFAHSGLAHFSGNMLFFLIFASSLEILVGSLGLLLVYLLSGVFAALSFSLMSDASAIPLIGASGAISGIMALFCVLLWSRGVKYIFFLLIPKRGFAGVIYLPAWLALAMWIFSDLAGLWSTPAALGGVAYSAHLGGEFCGALIGLILLVVRRWQGLPLIPKDLPFETKPIFTQHI